MSDSLIKISKNNSIVRTNEVFSITNKLTEKQANELFLKAYCLIQKAEKSEVLDVIQFLYFNLLQKITGKPTINRLDVINHQKEVFERIKKGLEKQGLTFVANDFENYQKYFEATRLNKFQQPKVDLDEQEGKQKDSIGENSSIYIDNKENCSDEVVYLIASLTTDETVFGLPKPVNFDNTWNTIQNILNNSISLDEQVQKLVASNEHFIPQLLEKLGIGKVDEKVILGKDCKDFSKLILDSFTHKSNVLKYDNTNEDALFKELFYNSDIQNKILNDENYFIDKLFKGHAKYEIKSIELLDKVLTVNPQHILALFLKGFLYYKLRDWENALLFSNKLMSLKPRFSKLYLFRGNVKSKMLDYLGGIEDYTEAIELNPNYAKAYFNRGKCKISLNNLLGTVEDYTRAIEIDEKNDYYFSERSKVYESLNDFENAIIDLKKAIEIDNKIHDYYCRLGDIFYKLKKYDESINSLYKALELTYCNKSLNNMALAKHKIKDYYGAIEYYTKVIESDADIESAYYFNRAIAKENLQNYLGAIEDYTKAIEIDPKDANAFQYRGLAKSKIGDLEGALNDKNMYNRLMVK